MCGHFRRNGRVKFGSPVYTITKIAIAESLSRKT